MPDKSLKNLRDKIDKIDQDIYALIQKRAAHAVQAGKIKSKASPKSSFYKPDRESKILRNIIKSNKKGLLPDSKIRAIYKELISGCLSLEEVLKIAYLGPEGTHSEAAVHNQFGSQVVKIPTTSIDDVFYQVMNDEVNVGVVPVENSSEGVINTTLNCLADSEHINVIGEIYLDIDHQLAAGNKFNISEAFAIASHPQALGQCSKWIERNIGNITNVFLGEYKIPILGRISMDTLTVDLSQIPSGKFNKLSYIPLIDNHYSILDLAKSCKTIPYEIMTSIGSRVKRVYIQ